MVITDTGTHPIVFQTKGSAPRFQVLARLDAITERDGETRGATPLLSTEFGVDISALQRHHGQADIQLFVKNSMRSLNFRTPQMATARNLIFDLSHYAPRRRSLELTRLPTSPYDSLSGFPSRPPRGRRGALHPLRRRRARPLLQDPGLRAGLLLQRQPARARGQGARERRPALALAGARHGGLSPRNTLANLEAGGSVSRYREFLR